VVASICNKTTWSRTLVGVMSAYLQKGNEHSHDLGFFSHANNGYTAR
jgi:hypothetical protein